MFIASKYEDIYPMKLSFLCEKAAYEKFSQEQIRNKEFEVLDCLKFDVLGPNIYSFTQLVANSLDLKSQMEPEKLSILYDLLTYMNKMVIYEYFILKNTKASLISAASFLVAFKLFEQIGKNFNIALNVTIFLL